MTHDAKQKPQDKFIPVKTSDAFGWRYKGDEIPDEIRLVLAKHGYLITHISDEDNDYRGAYCRVTYAEYEHSVSSQTYLPGDWIVFEDGYAWSKLSPKRTDWVVDPSRDVLILHYNEEDEVQ